MKYFHSKFMTNSAPLGPKPVNLDNVEIRFEHDLLKFRDAQNFSYQESPSVQLMFMASANGIRPVTTTNTNRNMFFIKHNDIPQFVAQLQKQYPDFKDHVTQKIETESKMNDFSKVSEW